MAIILLLNLAIISLKNNWKSNLLRSFQKELFKFFNFLKPKVKIRIYWQLLKKKLPIS